MNGQEKDDEIVGSGNMYTAEYWEYDARLGRRWNRDPVDKPWMSPYHAFSNKPIMNVDPNGATDTDFINSKTGEATHVEDGTNKVVTVNDADFNKVKELGSDTKKTWSKQESIDYMKIAETAPEIKPDSDIGKIARVVYGEMSGLGTSNTDRAVVAESIVNRKATGLYGDTYSDILTPGQYNAMTKASYKDPYKYMADMKAKSLYFYEANEKKIVGNFLDAYSAAYKAYNNIGPKVGNGVVSYVSPPLKSTHFNNDRNLTNITLSISGLKGISGVWKRK